MAFLKDESASAARSDRARRDLFYLRCADCAGVHFGVVLLSVLSRGVVHSVCGVGVAPYAPTDPAWRHLLLCGLRVPTLSLVASPFMANISDTRTT